MSPRRKTERDVPETDGTDGRHRRMSLRWKAKTDGPSVFMSFHLRDISFEWCVWVQRCASHVDASSGVCVGGLWLAGCVSVCVQERVTERACVLVGYTLDFFNCSHSVYKVMN